ncbi:MAG TPA: VWA domain-containing protein [Polyangiaceae bacterium]|nr:VWA domain-containing protein [Polyangiaceae bacterium]
MRSVAALLLAASACSDPERPSYYTSLVDAGYSDAGGIRPPDAGPPAEDAGGLCGNQVIPVILERPNVYFVMDRSGSMALPVDLHDRYTTARLAIADVLRAIGHRIAYGAAVLPAFRNPDYCATGEQVFATTQGDPLAADRTQNGPTLQTFLRLLSGYSPSGNTPIAATLVTLTPTLLALPGRTVVILATDGGPNCNSEARCGPERCILNIEGARSNDVVCAGDFNCCDPENLRDGPRMCVDEAEAVAALETLADGGVSTYVVGLPGSSVYADVLNRFAQAGGTARPSTPSYYATADRAELTDALRGIIGSVAISCDVLLDAEPPARSLVNVYFDQRVVPHNESDGWSWIGESALRIQGARCDELKSGDVARVQVVSGCETIVE